jgi:Flp pilus assembly protein TadD
MIERAANVDGFEAEAKKAHGELLVNQGRYAEGLVYLRRAQELKPRDYLQEYIDKVERIAQNR